MVITQPKQLRQAYSKQHLHSDELPYFVRGDQQIILRVSNERIAPAICYESLQTNHSDTAHRLGAEIYVATVAKSQKGVDKALIHYPEVARKYGITVMMSNCVGFCDNFESVGKSSVWTKEGDLAAQLDDVSEGIIVFDTETKETKIQMA